MPKVNRAASSSATPHPTVSVSAVGRRSGRGKQPSPDVSNNSNNPSLVNSNTTKEKKMATASATAQLAESSSKPVDPSNPFPWRHPDELGYVCREDWSRNLTIEYLRQNVFSIPPREGAPVHLFKVTKAKSGTVALPRGYRVPLMFVNKFLWDSLKLVMTATDPDKEWNEYRFEIVHLSRLCRHLFDQAEADAKKIIEKGGKGLDKSWRCKMFDRVLTRFWQRWLVNEEWSIRGFWQEFGEEEYQEDVLAHDWVRWVYKGHKGFTLTKDEVVNGISAQQFMHGLVRAEDKTWSCSLIPSSTQPLVQAIPDNSTPAPDPSVSPIDPETNSISSPLPATSTISILNNPSPPANTQLVMGPVIPGPNAQLPNPTGSAGPILPVRTPSDGASTAVITQVDPTLSEVVQISCPPVSAPLSVTTSSDIAPTITRQKRPLEDKTEERESKRPALQQAAPPQSASPDAPQAETQSVVDHSTLTGRWEHQKNLQSVNPATMLVEQPISQSRILSSLPASLSHDAVTQVRQPASTVTSSTNSAPVDSLTPFTEAASNQSAEPPSRSTVPSLATATSTIRTSLPPNSPTPSSQVSISAITRTSQVPSSSATAVFPSTNQPERQSLAPAISLPTLVSTKEPQANEPPVHQTPKPVAPFTPESNPKASGREIVEVLLADPQQSKRLHAIFLLQDFSWYLDANSQDGLGNRVRSSQTWSVPAMGLADDGDLDLEDAKDVVTKVCLFLQAHIKQALYAPGELEARLERELVALKVVPLMPKQDAEVQTEPERRSLMDREVDASEPTRVLLDASSMTSERSTTTSYTQTNSTEIDAVDQLENSRMEVDQESSISQSRAPSLSSDPTMVDIDTPTPSRTDKTLTLVDFTSDNLKSKRRTSNREDGISPVTMMNSMMQNLADILQSSQNGGGGAGSTKSASYESPIVRILLEEMKSLKDEFRSHQQRNQEEIESLTSLYRSENDSLRTDLKAREDRHRRELETTRQRYSQEIDVVRERIERDREKVEEENRLMSAEILELRRRVLSSEDQLRTQAISPSGFGSHYQAWGDGMDISIARRPSYHPLGHLLAQEGASPTQHQRSASSISSTPVTQDADRMGGRDEEDAPPLPIKSQRKFHAVHRISTS